jgi:uncharacterized protein (TIGR02118 family)
MIKLSVMYPNQQGKKFDVNYYCERHMRLVQDKFGAAVKGVGVEQGVAGAAPGAPPTYIAIGHVYFDSLEALQGALGGPHTAEIMADIPNYTDIEPIFQVSEVKL